MKVTFLLIRTARGNGGDKYRAMDDHKFILYFPQRITRKDSDQPREIIVLTFDESTIS